MTSQHQFSSSLIIIIFFFLFLFLIDVRISFADDEEINIERFNNCSTVKFNCGNQPAGIGYPFWGGNRFDYCGHPDYKLECKDGFAQIEINSIKYRVFNDTGENKIIRIVNIDFLDDACPSQFSNATNLTSNLFSPPGVSTLNIFYGCPSELDPVAGVNPLKFKCQGNNTRSTRDDAYLVPLPLSPIAEQTFSLCDTNVQVLIKQSGLGPSTAMNSESIVSVLREGIELGYGSVAAANFTFCDGCFNSGGQCGFNSTLDQHICFCRNGDLLSCNTDY